MDGTVTLPGGSHGKPGDLDSGHTVAQGLEAKLVFRNGPCRGKVVPLEGDRLSIGRSPDNHLVIDAGMIVSAHHAVLTREPGSGAWWIADSQSKNGTYLNGARLDKAKLCEGDLICFALSGPEVQFTTRKPVLPGLLETTLTTLKRTRSVEKAMRELLPARSADKQLVSTSGLRNILDSKLEKITQRTRWLVLSSAASFLILAAFLAGFLLWPRPHGDFRSSRQSLDVESAAAPALAKVDLIPQLEPIYGSLFLSYRDQPIGAVKIVSHESRALSGAKLTLNFEKTASGFLVEPFVAAVPEILPEKPVEVALLPRLSTEVLSPQTREVTVRLRLMEQQKVMAEEVRAVFVHGRNVFKWEKPESIAAFIDPQDPAVAEFVQQVWRNRPEATHQSFPPSAFHAAVSLFTGLADLGLRYLPDSRTPISQRVDAKAIDRVNFPWETLVSHTGDCDDLSILCASAFESAGIAAAIVVGPQHVLVLFDSGIEPAMLDSTPLESQTVIIWRDRVWIPLETTELGRSGASFTKAWADAWQRREAMLNGEMQIVEVREAWKSYQPMNPGHEERIQERIYRSVWAKDDLPQKIDDAVSSLKKLFLENLKGKEEKIKREEQPGAARDRAVGLLYARSGLFEQARRVLKRAIFGDAAPAGEGADFERALDGVASKPEMPYLLYDLGICFTLGARSAVDLRAAVLCLEYALNLLPRDEELPERGEFILRLALIHRLRGDLAAEKKWSEQAFQLNPALVSTYQQIIVGAGARAGENELIRRFLLKGLR